MTDFTAQIARIKQKLEKAKKADKYFKVIGASSHQYKLGDKVDENSITRFEEKYRIQLPLCYKAFITQIGNGGISYQKSAAGPYYGIYSFGLNVDELMNQPEEYLSKEVKIYPNMSDEYWNGLIKKIEENDAISDEEFDKEMGSIFSGILPIGSQGCTYLHGIVLNGEHKGRIVNLDISRAKPKFAHEDNFLDWYERWLDEIILGELIKDEPNWFGYGKRKVPAVNLDGENDTNKRKWYQIWRK